MCKSYGLGRYGSQYKAVLANALSVPCCRAQLLNRIGQEATTQCYHCGCERDSTQYSGGSKPCVGVRASRPGRTDRTKPVVPALIAVILASREGLEAKVSF